MNSSECATKDNSHLSLGARMACHKLELNCETYQDAFIEIAQEWEGAFGTPDYLRYFDEKVELLTLCKTPDDFKKFSSIFLPYFKTICLLGDGCAGFTDAILKAIKEGKIRTFEELDNFCKQVVDKNDALRDPSDDKGKTIRNGRQFEVLVEQVRCEMPI